MPALPEFSDAVMPADSLAPRDPDTSELTTRQPAAQLNPDGVIVSDTLGKRSLHPRQIQPGIIPTYYRVDGPGSGAVVGIVLGSVAGFLLIIWLLWTLTNTSGSAAFGAEEEIVVRRPRRNSHGTRSRRSTHTEVREYSRSPRRSGGRSTVIVEERRGHRPRSVVVEDRARMSGDDVVEVEYEEDYRSRRGSHRGSYRY